MQLSVSLLPSVRPVSAQTEIAVVIDVLRATSVMTTALAEGAKKLVTCQSVDQAREMANQFGDDMLLCGERNCQPIEGFHLGNSPAEYRPEIVKDRTLVLTTTNGTQAIAAAKNAQAMVAASFLNLSAVIDKIQNAGSIHIVCAGTNAEVTAEDVLLCGAIIHRLNRLAKVNFIGDEPILAEQLWTAWIEQTTGERQQSLTKRLGETYGGRNLIKVGYEADLSRCAAIDRYNSVPHRVTATPTTFALAKLGDTHLGEIESLPHS